MNTKLSLFFVFSILCVCGCELGTDRVYMEMYEAMNANSDVIENGIDERIGAIREAVKRKPDYRVLVPTAEKIRELTLDFNNFINDLDERLDESDFKAIGNDEIKGKIVVHRHKIIEILKKLYSNKTLRIKEEEVEELIDLHFFPNGTLPLINGKPFNDYSFENQSIACNKAVLGKQKNDALILAKAAVDYLGGKVGGTIICGFNPIFVVSSPKKGFIIKGETFETDIFLYYAHIEHPRKLEMIIKVDDKEIPSKGGVATYKTTPTVYGEHRYEVKISVKNPFNNKFEIYRRTFAFEVGERCYE